jgi:hypothetical protein
MEHDTESYRKLLANIYKAADYLGERAERRARDFSRNDNLRNKDGGLSDAYSHIKHMILNYDTTGQADYWKSNKVTKELPDILK